MKGFILNLGLGLMCASLGFAEKSRIFEPNQVIPYKTIGDIQLKMNIFVPSGHTVSDHRPAIIFFHGGSWVYGDPNQFYPHCRYLASRGITAISAEYRIESKHGTSPSECVKDGKSAIRWLRQHADQLGIDPNRIAAGGGSAGAQVAAAAATLKTFNDPADDLSISCIPSALTLFNPVIDNSPEGYGYDRVKAYWQDFSPLHNLNKDVPPTIIFLGTKDHLVPVSTAKCFQEKLKSLGVRCDLFLYQDQDHGFFNYINTEYYEKTIAELDQFLTSLGYLKKEK